MRTYLIPTLLAIHVLLSCSSEPVATNKETSKLNLTTKIFDSSNWEGEAIYDLSYGYHEQQKFDIYLPESRTSETTKVIVLLHGGAWQYGSKENLADLVGMLQVSQPDVAIVNANFILANENNPAFPNQFHDIKSLLSYIKAGSLEFQVKPEFAIIGRSSGGHLALMYDALYDKDNSVTAVGSISGPTDFTDSFYQDLPNFDDLIDILVDEEEYPNFGDILELLSPAFNATENSSPTILFHGQNDDVVPFSNAVTLSNILEKNNVFHELKSNEEGHGNWSIEAQGQMKDQLTVFLNEHFVN